MPIDLQYLEGKKMCVVFVKDNDDPEAATVSLRTLHGRANIQKTGSLIIEHENGCFNVPSSAYTSILPNDGTELLGEAEYYLFCKVAGMEL